MLQLEVVDQHILKMLNIKNRNDKAKMVYQKYASDPFPFNVIAFGKELGIKIRESYNLKDSIVGFIKKIDDTIYICVNGVHSENRKRFTIAHELGHYFLHSDSLQQGLVDNILHRENGIINQKEQEANTFAANLLMPSELFKTLWLREEAISTIATMFFVSESAVLTRAKYLGLINGFNEYFL